MAKVLTLGESLIRLSSAKGQRLGNSSILNLTYGGAEANVAINMSLLDHQVKYATKLPTHNDLAENCAQHLRSYGVNTDDILWGNGRIGVYFLETGTGLRASNIVYDREYSTISQMTDLEWDLDKLFDGVEVFHLTGITCALSKEWQQMSVDLVKAAAERGIKVSFDMNYRASMWGYDEARETYSQILPHVNYLSAGRLDAINFMNVPETEDSSNWEYYASQMASLYPNLEYIYATNRRNVNPNSYVMFGHLWDCVNSEGAQSKVYTLDNVVDRVGTGDAYAAGILDGITNGRSMNDTVEFGMACDAIKHTIKGDVNQFRRDEIESFMNNQSNILR